MKFSNANVLECDKSFVQVANVEKMCKLATQTLGANDTANHPESFRIGIGTPSVESRSVEQYLPLSERVSVFGSCALTVGRDASVRPRNRNGVGENRFKS